MNETRKCPNCSCRMKINGQTYKGQSRFLYLICPKCGAKRKIQITEKILENYGPIFQPVEKLNSANPLTN